MNDARPTVLSLGDSFSCGEGVGVRLEVHRTWAGLLAEAMGARHEVLALAGATTAEVRSRQLPIAVTRPPSWVTLLVGLNDVFRAGFDARRSATELHAMVGDLRTRHHGVLLVRLHDPTTILPIPARVRRALQARVATVNAAVDAAGVAEGVTVMDLAEIDALDRREAWAVDRLHPSEYGHTLIGMAAANAISAAGAHWPSAVVSPAPVTIAPTRVAECGWVMRHGVPWVARRTGMLSSVLRTMLADAGDRPAHA